MPEYPGGTAGWSKYLAKNMIYPPKALENAISARVVLKFRVRKDGTVHDISIFRRTRSYTNPQGKFIRSEVLPKIGYGIDEEAVRLLKTSGKWKPGIKEGKAVNTEMMIPIFFRLPQPPIN